MKYTKICSLKRILAIMITLSISQLSAEAVSHAPEQPELSAGTQASVPDQIPNASPALIPELFAQDDTEARTAHAAQEEVAQEIASEAVEGNEDPEPTDPTIKLLNLKKKLLDLDYKNKIENIRYLALQLQAEFQDEIQKIDADEALSPEDKEMRSNILTEEFMLKLQGLEVEHEKADLEYQEQSQDLSSGNHNGKVYIPFEDVMDFEKARRIVNMAPNDIKLNLSLIKEPNVPDFCKPKKLMLVGPPGTGKTTLIKAIASSIGYPCKIIRATELFTTYQNSAVDNLNRSVNEIIKMDQKCIIGLDEMEVIFRNHNNELNQNRDAAAALWLLIDKCESNPNIIFIGATNDISKLPAQLKSRFQDTTFTLDLPEKKSREEALRIMFDHISNDVELDEAIEQWYLKKLIAKTKKCSIREIEKLVQTALQIAIHKKTSNLLLIPAPSATDLPDTDGGVARKTKILLTPQDFEQAFKRLKLHRTGFRGVFHGIKTKLIGMHEHFESHLPAWQLSLISSAIILPAWSIAWRAMTGSHSAIG